MSLNIGPNGWSEMSRNLDRYLNLRGLTWWFKREIPKALRSHFNGKTTYLENLGTGDKRIARKRRDEIRMHTDRLFADAQAGRPMQQGQDTVRTLAESWASEITEAQKNPQAWTAKALGLSADEMEEGDDLSPFDMLEDAARAVEEGHGKEAKRRFLNIARGKVEAAHYVESYLKEAKLAPKTTDERRNLLTKFGRWAEAEGLTLADINRSAAGRYFSNNISQLHPQTAKKHTSSVKLYWDYLIRRGHVKGKNPWEGQMMPNRGRRVERGDEVKERPFTSEEMKTLLYSPFPEAMTAEFKQQLHDVMRISALSGMRLAEACTLWVEECPIDADGKGMFLIRQGKTQAAARNVPIHPDLVDIVRRRSKDKGPTDWLFHELRDEKSPSDVLGKRFAAYRKKFGIDDKPEGRRRSLANFHSFRRWFITEAEQAGQQESIISEVVGHEEGRKSIALKVYSGGPSEEQKRRCVEAVKLPSSASVRGGENT